MPAGAGGFGTEGVGGTAPSGFGAAAGAAGAAGFGAEGRGAFGAGGFGGEGMVVGIVAVVGTGFGGKSLIGEPLGEGGRTIRTVSFLGSFMVGYS
jgi:hypothetical protein